MARHHNHANAEGYHDHVMFDRGEKEGAGGLSCSAFFLKLLEIFLINLQCKISSKCIG